MAAGGAGGGQQHFSRGLSDKGAKKMAGKTAEAESKAETTEEKGGSKKKLLLIVGPLVVIGALAAVYFLFLRGGSSADPHKVVHHPGAVVALDPITINLAGGHFLKLGLALQPEAGATELDG
jgi:flagellar FliL protein